MQRPPATLQWLAVFGSGLALGLTVGGRGPTLSAQQPAGGPARPAASVAIPPRPITTAAADQELQDAYDKFRATDRVFELVARHVSPSVVHIVAKKSGKKDDGEAGTFEESGSGIIVQAEVGRGRFVLTNNHVVDGADVSEIAITLHDGQVLHPDRVWVDDKTDVAVLKLNRDDLPAARLGDSDRAVVGTWVLALGSPFGLTHSVSQGIISARGRYEEELESDGVEQQEFLQTDAAINPGNSGGPLVNLRGEVVGINTAIASEGGGSEGVGFSIPINLVKWAMSQLVTKGKVSRGAMGINLQKLTSQKAVEIGLSHPQGARILTVHEDSPASRAGLRIGDVVLRFNGEDVLNHNHLINLVSMSPIGPPVEIVIWRDRAAIKTTVEIADRDAVLARAVPRFSDRKVAAVNPQVAKADDLGLALTLLDDAIARRYFPQANELYGVFVAKIDPRSPLAPFLKPADLIQAVGGQVTQTVEDARSGLNKGRGADPLDIVVLRSNHGVAERRTLRIP